MTITLEILKNDEAQLLAQMNYTQGRLDYNRQQQEFLAKQQEQTKAEDDPPAEPNVPIR